MATHSSLLPWEIPWTEEPGRLQSMESQRVRHNPATKQNNLLFTSYPIRGSFLWQPKGFPDSPSGKVAAWQYRRCKKLWFEPWVVRIPWRRAWQPTPVFLPGEFREQRSLVGYSP